MSKEPRTQRSRALAALRTAGQRGICLADVDPELAYTLRNRLAELRSQGHVIKSAPCRAHDHRGGVRRYVLVIPPPPGRQEALPLP